MTMTNERLVALKRMGLRGPALVLLTLAVGAAVLWWTGQVTTERMQAELLGKARIAAQALEAAGKDADVWADLRWVQAETVCVRNAGRPHHISWERPAHK